MTATEDGNTGGIGSCAFTPTSTGWIMGRGTGCVRLLAGFSAAVWVTVTLELCLAMRGSLRVMLTEETVGVGRLRGWIGCKGKLRSSW